MTKFVYTFAEGNAGMKNLLGGKGANLAEMTRNRTSCSAWNHCNHRQPAILFIRQGGQLPRGLRRPDPATGHSVSGTSHGEENLET
jgi:hypothetical protein